MQNVRKQSGFTLIELMIVIAILAILVAIALPAYQNYSVRAKASECLSVAASPKLALAETYQSQGSWVTNWSDAGYAPEASQYCASAGDPTANGSFTIATQATGADTEIQYTFSPSVGGGARIDWTCTTQSGVNTAHVPSECRGN